jgi:hypothetical protein
MPVFWALLDKMAFDAGRLRGQLQQLTLAQFHDFLSFALVDLG